MTLTTKLDIGQKVWLMHENRAVEAIIDGVRIAQNRERNAVEYEICTEQKQHFHLYETSFENCFFLTKEELLKSL